MCEHDSNFTANFNLFRVRNIQMKMAVLKLCKAYKDSWKKMKFVFVLLNCILMNMKTVSYFES